jgi:hypothetical protein
MDAQDYRNLQEAYTAVYDEDLRDELEEMSDNFFGVENLSDEEIAEIIDETIDEMLDEGYYFGEIEYLLEGVLLELNPYAPAGSKESQKYARSTTATKRREEAKAARQAAVSKVKGAVKSALERARGAVGSGVERTRGAVGSGVERVGKAVGSGVERVGKAGATAVSNIKDRISNIKDRIKTKIAQAQAGASSAARRTGQAAKSFVGKTARSVASGAGAVASRLGEDYDLYDLILSHLLNEGYADTNENALAIMANMSEEWRESIVDEAYQEPMLNRKHYLKKLSTSGGMGMGTPEDSHGYRDPKMAKVGAEFSERTAAAVKAKKTGEPDSYRAEKEAQSKYRK